MPADLHVHTNFSDGTDSPEVVVEKAKNAGITEMAITDHDVVDGIDRAAKKGRDLGVEVIPGIEFTTEALGAEIHILGYYIDHHDHTLLKTIKKIQKSREERIFKICEKLKELGISLEAEKVFEIAGHRAAGRPHIARAMIKEGYVRNFKEAFGKYIDFHGPAYVAHYKLSPEEAIKLVIAAKGIPVYAHPAVSNCDQIIPDLISAGLAGIEVYYPGHNREQTAHYLDITKKYALLATGGSDYHGKRSGREIGIGYVSITDDLMEKIRSEYLHRNKPRGD
ncbi:MAG: PHP domain-containing protein [Candidatus Margulisiibacteriota bacterium]|nr:PHP domain-containing protein [Candidatus Margulisiibacteriota bacterium]